VVDDHGGQRGRGVEQAAVDDQDADVLGADAWGGGGRWSGVSHGGDGVRSLTSGWCGRGPARGGCKVGVQLAQVLLAAKQVVGQEGGGGGSALPPVPPSFRPGQPAPQASSSLLRHTPLTPDLSNRSCTVVNITVSNSSRAFAIVGHGGTAATAACGGSGGCHRCSSHVSRVIRYWHTAGTRRRREGEGHRGQATPARGLLLCWRCVPVC